MELLITLTHARLRARQGDVRTARRIVREILREEPGNAEARALLESWGDGTASAAAADGAAAVRPGGTGPATSVDASGDDAGVAARRRKVARLERWLARMRGGGRA